MSQQIAVGPPDLKTADPRLVAIAHYLRHNKIVKARACLFNSAQYDLFKVKRVVRALQDPAYDKARQRNPLLPEIKTRQDCIAIIQRLPSQRLAFGVERLETEQALARSLKPKSGVPCVEIMKHQNLVNDNDYLIWFYNPVSLLTRLYGLGAIVACFTCVMYPLWPRTLRQGVYYLSLLLIGFVVMLFGLGVVRLIIFCITYFTLKPGFWLFPNLFEDVGFFESFKPVYSWHGQKTLPQKPKKKKRKPTPVTPATKAQIENQAKIQNMQQKMAQNPKLQQMMQVAVQDAVQRAEARKKEILAGPNAPKDEAKIKELMNNLVVEEMQKSQEKLKHLTEA